MGQIRNQGGISMLNEKEISGLQKIINSFVDFVNGLKEDQKQKTAIKVFQDHLKEMGEKAE